jgi:diguanylate cyclase (GGDEF)-like protein/PAS domain S-box-containing protein
MKKDPREQLIHELAESGVFDSMGDGVSVQDTDFKVLYQNSRHKMLVGEHVGEYCYNAYERRDQVCDGCPLAMSFEDGSPHTGERTVSTEEGIGHVEITASVLRDKAGTLIAGIEVVRDITNRKRLEDELRISALTDDLTGLRNRRGFFTLADQQCKLAARNKRPLALVFLDLDDLKIINDRFGHETGDQALEDIANILKITFRESDILARLGGDEFAILLTELSDLAMSHVIIDHIQDNIEEHNELSTQDYELSVAAGIAHFDPDQPCTISELLNQADKLMYSNKKNRQI